MEENRRQEQQLPLNEEVYVNENDYIVIQIGEE